MSRPAREVSAALRAAGIPTGYRYTQTGFHDRDGRPVAEHGVMVSRKGAGRRNRGEDLGYVRVSPVFVHRGDASPDEQRDDESWFVSQIVAALIDAGLPVARASTLVVIVPDDDHDGSTP